MPMKVEGRSLSLKVKASLKVVSRVKTRANAESFVSFMGHKYYKKIYTLSPRADKRVVKTISNDYFQH